MRQIDVRKSLRWSWLLAAVLLASSADAQYFGQNKIAYANFDWQVYKSPHFDVYYYPETEPFLEDIVSYAESAYVHLSRTLDHELRFRVPLITYKTHGEFQQTNITLAELPDGVGAFAEPVQYRMVLPIDLPPDELYALIAHELTHIFEYSYFYDGYLGRAIRGRAPTWLMEGLASYLGDDETNLDRMAIRDAVVNNILPPIESLNVVTFLTYRYGHAIFDYIEQEHGIEGVRTFLFEFKKVLLTGNLSKAIEESLGYDIDEFNRRFNRYLRQKYFPVLLEKKSPDDYGTELGTRKLRGVFTFSPALSPSGELVAALGVPGMELDLVVLSAEDGTLVKNLTKGWTNKYRNLVAEVFKGKRDLSWSPREDHVAVFVRRENRWPLFIFDALSGNIVDQIAFDDIYQNASPAFSTDGRRIAFEGNRNGIVDIFEVDLDTREVRNLTQDDFFDANPWYGPDGKTLLYNRRIGEHWKVFSVDLEDSSKKTQLTFGPYSELQPSYSRDGNTIYYASDRGEYGVFNLFSLDLQTGDLRQYTDVVGGCFSPVEAGQVGDETFLVFTAYYRGMFRLYRMPLRAPEATIGMAQRLEEPTEAEPFEPDMRLRTDEDQKARYKLKWDIEAPDVGVGVANDGTFLANAAISFSDLMGDHRVTLAIESVSSFQSYWAQYTNIKRRGNWGARVYDVRDFIVSQVDGSRLEQGSRATGADLFYEYPISRYYRLDFSVGVADTSYLTVEGFDAVSGEAIFGNIEDTLGIVSADLVGDTTRYQRWGPFQGKRFRIGAEYGPRLGGDRSGDMIRYNVDFRAYKQVTRRSVLAFRTAGVIGAGEIQNSYSFGGINQLRGYEYREFTGSRIAWMNLEFRFPLVDEMLFPILALQDIRGFFFADVGSAWYDKGAFSPELSADAFYDPAFGLIRADYSGLTPAIIPWDFWDSENDRLQDGRASYGVGFQFLFLGGLQFNWTWAKRLPHTQYLYAVDPFTGALDLSQPPVPVEEDNDTVQTEFYIAFDW
ncbi:MAG TPA: BamA/TamA family outer membrane protein [Candidatus Polarisedimenticolaceae bacterium]|nr:BamA/TamA family outer membrane protein [Candidatus Polarisedimenticolaceae bacterium]